MCGVMGQESTIRKNCKFSHMHTQSSVLAFHHKSRVYHYSLIAGGESNPWNRMRACSSPPFNCAA